MMLARGITKKLRVCKVDAITGFEIVGSLRRIEKMKDMLNKKRFGGYSDVPEVMGRDRFEQIRGSLRLYPSIDHDFAIRDPLWDSRVMPDHFPMNCCQRCACWSYDIG